MTNIHMYLATDNLSAANFTSSDTTNRTYRGGVGKLEKFNLKKCHLSASDILLHAAHCTLYYAFCCPCYFSFLFCCAFLACHGDISIARIYVNSISYANCLQHRSRGVNITKPATHAYAHEALTLNSII